FGQSKKNSGFEDDSAILEALEPHQSLRQLYIKNYTSPTVSPIWMLSLINLRQVVLVGCDNCEILPSLGELPFLEGFNANGMNSLKKVGVEFLLMRKRDDAEEEEDGETSRDDGFRPPNAIVSFPKLKLLRFEDFPQWEKWEGTNTETGLIHQEELEISVLVHREQEKNTTFYRSTSGRQFVSAGQFRVGLKSNMYTNYVNPNPTRDSSCQKTINTNPTRT
ncbi:hypothetical protein TorRG33x02_095600, partial [Trema orientale]